MRALLRLLPPHRIAMSSAMWLGLASALAALALAEGGGRLVHGAIGGVVRGEVLATVAALGVARIALSWLQSVVAFRLGHRLATELRTELLRRALAIDLVAAPPMAELTTRITHDVTVLQALVAFRLPAALADGLTALALLVLALVLDATSVASAALPLALALPLIAVVAHRSTAAQDEARTGYGRVIGAISETLAASAVLRQHDAVPATERSLAATLGRFEADALRARSLAAISAPMTNAAALVALLVVAVSIATRVGSGAIDAPAAIGVVAALSLAARPVARLAATVTDASSFLASARRVDALLALPPVSAPSVRSAERLDKGLALRGLTVRRGERRVLDGIDLDVARGERVAIVGPNGAGKTTLLLAVLGLIDHEGSISVDDTAGDARRLCAWVPQEPVLLEGTILTNISLGAPPDRARAEAALEQVGADAWVEARGGLDAPVEASGRNLSLGERQRLCLARALYRDRTILVLDEPTAALDPDSAQAFDDAVGELLRERGLTALVVTHDAALAARCDRTVRLVGGRLA